MKHLVEDETGAKWVVMPEDPAWWAVQKLRKDIEYVVLTRYMIQHGHSADAGEVMDDDLERMAIAYDNTKSPALGRGLRRLLRLRVCLDRVGEMDHEEK